MKFFSREDIPWVALIWESYYESRSLPSTTKNGSFWWRDILKLLDKFKGMAMVNINNAKTCFLWSDIWNGNVPMISYPELHLFSKSNTTILAEAKNRNILDLFNLPLSQEALNQLGQLQQDLSLLGLNENNDIWTCIRNFGKFSVAKEYRQLSGHRMIHPSFNGSRNVATKTSIKSLHG
jgi:hypothetical protein